MTPVRFGAPWGRLLWTFTIVGVVILVGSPAAVMLIPDLPGLLKIIIGLSAALTVGACALFIVRGYRLEDDVLVIEHLGWERRISLRGLQRAEHNTNLLDGALRVGNGGLFVFAGYFWSKELGWFRLAGNDILGRPVLLVTPSRKQVITPDDPEKFVAAVSPLVET